MTPDFKRLAAVNAELRKLLAQGRLTKAEYDRLLREAEECVGEHTQFLEGILMRGVELGFVSY